MPTRLQHVQELFEAALAREPADRPAFLGEACGDDAGLRAEVESLLAHDVQAGEGFMRPAEVPPGVRRAEAAEGPDPLIGKSVGHYRIKSVIGVGGMGTVYLAEQEHPHRDVALKVMRAGVASRSALRRFEYEAEILARLRHPNIAQVYEAGVHRDREGILGPAGQSRDREGAVLFGSVPYFAMEYIPDAKPITGFAEDNGLGARERLKLFAQVCDAVHHGHQKGVIHRDIKPGNILVDSSGQAKIIDFGVARATDSDIAVTTQQTGVGDLIGTLQYMSPEQCAADPHDLDTRSDVYSLGVVLYELLCGQLPYDLTRTPIPVAPRVICERPPLQPSTINSALRGDLEAIVLKALEKERDERYQCAADLARDIRHYLNRDPIEARPPTVWTRAIRWVGRNPVIATTAACLSIGAVIIGATALCVWIVNARPHEIDLLKKPGYEWHPGGYEARLLSISGRALKTWASESDYGIRCAELVERPAEFGGGRLALLGFDNTPGNDSPVSLRAFDADGDLEQPVWERRIEPDDVLPELRGRGVFVAERFDLKCCWALDVFPARPGSEIVAVFGHRTYSPRVIRVYDLRGELLYQVWHDGAITTCHWMWDAALLVFAGDCHGPYWKDGKPVGDETRALVVFALRPEADFVASAYLDYQSQEAGDTRLDPAWYLRLHLRSWPKDAVEVAERIIVQRPNGNDPGRCATCVVHVDDRNSAAVSWVINEFGERVGDKPVVTDGYRGNQNLPDSDPCKLPDPNDFDLVPFEPTGPTASRSTPEGASDSADGENDGP